MRKGLPILMLITMLAIGLFQAYWLIESYQKEESNLMLRTRVAFSETVRRLQAKKLKLDPFFNDSTGNIRIDVADKRSIPALGEEEVAGFLNNITMQVNDSLNDKIIRSGDGRREIIRIDTFKERPDKKRNVVISLSNSDMMFRNDSAKEFEFKTRTGHPGGIIRFLYGVDSLQDSLRIGEIDSAYRAALHKEKIDVPFSVSRINNPPQRGIIPGERGGLNKITIGFAHPVTYEMKLGNTTWYLIRKLVSPILFSVFLVGVTLLSFVLLYRNIQRQRRLAEIKNEFISNITHELKTPIATVGVAIEALRNFNALSDPERTKEYLDISRNELQRLSLLVDKVLKLSMFENKEIELKFESLNLKDLAEEVVSSMRLQIEKNNATVSVNQEGNVTIQGDKLHLLSVVYNLLDNALKYSNGNTNIKIDLKEKENNVQLTMTDNGIGISPEYKDKVFEKFFRVPAGDTHNTKGYGLGLSYVSHVVQKHKGKIELESQPGSGTKFIITIPKTTLP
ncbi:MAG TPA: HAMP domain-containing sensor histidine kinase [Chitinophagaceae bacterium]|nr:HAMP domain-containing sensor histidine kinase [Chitinophagaceae bacterium]